MSNIMAVFNPPEPQDVEECFGCTCVQLAVCLGSGAYLLSPKAIPTHSTVHPMWFRAAIRAGGVGLLALGVLRAREAYRISK